IGKLAYAGISCPDAGAPLNPNQNPPNSGAPHIPPATIGRNKTHDGSGCKANVKIMPSPEINAAVPHLFDHAPSWSPSINSAIVFSREVNHRTATFSSHPERAQSVPCKK